MSREHPYEAFLRDQYQNQITLRVDRLPLQRHFIHSFVMASAREPRHAKVRAKAALLRLESEDEDIGDEVDSASEEETNPECLDIIHEEQGNEPVPSTSGRGTSCQRREGLDVQENDEWKDKNGNTWHHDPPVERR